MLLQPQQQQQHFYEGP
ncbi:hypothetical protein ETH_00037770 [Eimeria tenella]|uniref:Uncharacterized protein n=1 Tax=Eimeria tenella TaxID=5802 RepID=U6KVT1_EIMTE|nr:hypothetical protein ETH_00037770 [Eimeria tenella]